LIILHPRTAKEKFKRLARWEYVGALQKELRIPIAGNGDIIDADSLLKRASGPCDAVMVGRAAVRQPWIFAEARNKVENSTKRDFFMKYSQHGDTEAQRDERCSQAMNVFSMPLCRSETFIEEIGLRFLELLARYQPPEFYISRARRFFGFFCDNLKWGNYMKNQLNREETLSGIEKTWQEYFKTQN
jgi:tRNA-dihydrouridine synthase